MKNRATIVKMEAEINPVVSPGVEKFSNPTAKAEIKTESSNHFKTEGSGMMKKKRRQQGSETRIKKGEFRGMPSQTSIRRCTHKFSRWRNKPLVRF